MSRVAVALAVALTLLAVVVGWTLTRSPTTVLASNGASNQANLLATATAAQGCQSGETIPAGTTAIRLSIGAEIGPAVNVAVKTGGRTLTHGSRAQNWTGGVVTVPVQRVASTANGAEVCFGLATPLEAIVLFGTPSAGSNTLQTSVPQLTKGRLAIEYLHSGPSWLSLLSTVSWRMGIGHGWPGSWIVFALLIAMLGGAALLSMLVLRELR